MRLKQSLEQQDKKVCKPTAFRCFQCFSLCLLLFLASRVKWLPEKKRATRDGTATEKFTGFGQASIYVLIIFDNWYLCRRWKFGWVENFWFKTRITCIWLFFDRKVNNSSLAQMFPLLKPGEMQVYFVCIMIVFFLERLYFFGTHFRLCHQEIVSKAL